MECQCSSEALNSTPKASVEVQHFPTVMTDRNKQRTLSSFFGGSMTPTSKSDDSDPSDFSAKTSADTVPEPTQDGGIATTEYAQRRRELMQLVTGLLGQGAHQIIDIPRIAVIGGQSAGKSSVVEAVTGLNVPRDSGTCTRCPMECTMSSSASTWSCQISLRYEYDEAGVKMSATQHSFSPVLTDRGEVELWIRRAQVAILSLHRTVTECQSLSEDHLKEIQRLLQKNGDRSILQFSKNVVCVDIKDPDATDLSFIDLPGLVQNMDADLVELVKNLTVSTIEQDSTIILVTIPLTDEMENQLAFRLAKEADPEGKRTVGVLTKPDKLQAGDVGARQRWKDVILGRAHALNHGYYCLRLPSDGERERTITRAQGEEIATAYFASDAPWNELNTTDRQRLGVSNLVSDLSRLLMHVLEKALPKLRKDITCLHSDCNANLAALPPVPDTNNATATVILKISKFTSELSRMVYGRGDVRKDLIQRNQGSYGVLRRKIHGTAPDFRPFDDRLIRPGRPAYPGDEDGDPDPLVDPLDLVEVRRILKKHIGWELPGHIPFEATKEMLDSSLTLWSEPTQTCLESAFRTLAATVDELVKDHFRQLTLFESTVRDIIQSKLDEVWDKASSEVEHTLQREREPLWTQNDEYFLSSRSKWLGIYKTERHAPRTALDGLEGSEPLPTPTRSVPSSRSVQTHQTRALEALAALGFDGLCAADFHRLFPADKYDEELGVMADVRAHFQVAYKRIIDQVPLTIEHSMNQPFADGLHAALLGVLDIGSVEKMEALLSEDPIIARKRADLAQSKARLIDIQRRLERFVL